MNAVTLSRHCRTLRAYHAYSDADTADVYSDADIEQGVFCLLPKMLQMELHPM